jgi:hypothetical protein
VAWVVVYASAGGADAAVAVAVGIVSYSFDLAHRAQQANSNTDSRRVTRTTTAAYVPCDIKCACEQVAPAMQIVPTLLSAHWTSPEEHSDSKAATAITAIATVHTVSGVCNMYSIQARTEEEHYEEERKARGSHPGWAKPQPESPWISCNVASV